MSVDAVVYANGDASTCFSPRHAVSREEWDGLRSGVEALEVASHALRVENDALIREVNSLREALAQAAAVSEISVHHHEVRAAHSMGNEGSSRGAGESLSAPALGSSVQRPPHPHPPQDSASFDALLCQLLTSEDQRRMRLWLEAALSGTGTFLDKAALSFQKSVTGARVLQLTCRAPRAPASVTKPAPGPTLSRRYVSPSANPGPAKPSLSLNAWGTASVAAGKVTLPSDADDLLPRRGLRSVTPPASRPGKSSSSVPSLSANARASTPTVGRRSTVSPAPLRPTTLAETRRPSTSAMHMVLGGAGVPQGSSAKPSTSVTAVRDSAGASRKTSAVLPGHQRTAVVPIRSGAASRPGP